MSAIENTEAGYAGRFSQRSVRSFVLRQGRMSEAQSRALREILPKVGVSYRPQALDLVELFGRQAPTVVEIGFGMGETTAKIAQAKPDWNFLGIEVHGPGVGSLCKLIESNAISNLRIIQHDAVEVLRDMIAPASLDGVHLFFPDPWPKARHHKRRIVQPDFVQLVASRLRPEGYFHCATDWAPYAEWMLEMLRAEPMLRNTAADYAERPDYRPLTKFEQRGLRLGHQVFDLIFRRQPGGDAASST